MQQALSEGTFAAVVWVHHGHALVARRTSGHPGILELDRAGATEHEFLRHVAEAAPACRRMMILGPDEERLAFDREYATVYDGSARFVEVEACAEATPSELLDRLRFLEGNELRSVS